MKRLSALCLIGSWFLFAGSLCFTSRLHADEGSIRVPGPSSSMNGAEGQAAPKKRPLEEQEALGRELYSTMAKTDRWDTDVFIRLHSRVIEECPDTRRAQESLWRLSNLYLTGTGSEPNYPEIILLLEHLVERYPNSPLIYDAKQRLLVAYEETGNMRKARALYEERLASDTKLPESGDYAAILLGYAKTLTATGEPGRAREVYGKIMTIDPPPDSWLVDIVKDDLAELDKKKGPGAKEK